MSHFDQIFTIDPVSRQVRQVTAMEGGNPQAPAWSPDGTRIAFHVVYGGAVDAELFVIDADGTHLEQLTDNAVEGLEPGVVAGWFCIAFVRDGRMRPWTRTGAASSR